MTNYYIIDVTYFTIRLDSAFSFVDSGSKNYPTALMSTHALMLSLICSYMLTWNDGGMLHDINVRE